MSLQKVEALCPVPDSVRRAVEDRKVAGLNWVLILQLVQKFGPVAMQIIEAIISGTVPA